MSKHRDTEFPILQKVSSYIAKHHLLTLEKRYLVAFSGGADSLALLLILKELRYSIEAIHCNFHLRGEESDRDEHFCAELCESIGIKIHRVHFDTRAYADLHKVSIEMAARELRYRYFEQLRQDVGADGICVAHHRDDSVETVLMNLVRGTGIHGLLGIRPRNGYVLRPLLCVDKKEIEAFLASMKDVMTGSLGQRYVTDSTNLETDATRNKFRLTILPRLADIHPSVSQSIAETAERLAGVAAIYDAAVSESVGRCRTERGFSIEKILAETVPEHVFYAILSTYGFTSDQVYAIFSQLHGPSGRMWESPSHWATVDRGELLLMSKDDEEVLTEGKVMIVPESGTYVFSSSKKFSFLIKMRNSDFQPSRERNEVTLDAAVVKWPLAVRHIQNGDRFVPFGMKGSRLVSDYLTDRKSSLFDKHRQLAVTDADGRIIWLVGERTDHRFRITEATTSVLHISLRSE